MLQRQYLNIKPLGKIMAKDKSEVSKLFEENRKIIDKAIEKFIPKEITLEAFSNLYGKPKYKIDLEAIQEAVNKPIWNMLERGGKRWRAVLFLLVYEALGGKKEDGLDFAIIPEVIHNGTLIVDDIEDGSDLRRGKPAIHKLFGEDITINAGNIMYYLPLTALLKNKGKFDDKILSKVYKIYVEEMIDVSMGQALDIAWHRGLANANNVSEEEFLQMCLYKTGSLARMSAKMAATLVGSDDKTIETLGEMAGNIGVAFQIQDDILNLISVEFQKKKGFGEDITEGKRSLLVIHTMKEATDADRKRLLEILNSHTKDRKLIEEAIEIIKKNGSVEYSKSIAKKIIKDSWTEVDKLLPESDAKDKLKKITEFLVEREV